MTQSHCWRNGIVVQSGVFILIFFFPLEIFPPTFTGDPENRKSVKPKAKVRDTTSGSLFCRRRPFFPSCGKFRFGWLPCQVTETDFGGF
jgi:hypothetical protein